MVEKTTHFGRAGEFFAMSELLLRGWNVAVPVVDLGDDVFVIDDNEKTAYRIQVKTARADPRDAGHQAQFRLSRRQLATALPVELFYALIARIDERWQYFVIPREDLFALRRRFEAAPRSGSGRPPVSDATAKTDDLTLAMFIGKAEASGWGNQLGQYMNRWPDELAAIPSGPGGRSA
jgi:hypothetical protein